MNNEPGDFRQLSDFAPLIVGPIMAFALSILRALYDTKEPRFLRVLLEALMCSGITITAIAAIFLFFPGLEGDISKAVIVAGGTGAFIGFLGVYQIRRLILKFLDIKITGKS